MKSLKRCNILVEVEANNFWCSRYEKFKMKKANRDDNGPCE